MYQRLLLLLCILSISGVSMAQNVLNSGDGDYVYDKNAASGSVTNPVPLASGMQKWVHDPTQKNRIGSWQSVYKSYRYDNISFRLRFPNNYDSTKKYPLVIFLHGEGEASQNYNANNTVTVDRENQDQLYWGAQLFSDRMNSGEFNGFILFPQLQVDINNAGAQWSSDNLPEINGILDNLALYKGLDADRVTVMGLSAGGVGSIVYAELFPTRIASVIASSPKEIEANLGTSANFQQIPIWIAGGGTDAGPNPSNSFSSYDNIASQGTNIYLSYYANKDHDTWETMWAQRDANYRLMTSLYWNSAHKAQPIVYFQHNDFCKGQPISAKMGITGGFAAYEWQMDNGSGFTTIAGATSNIYTATQAGQYRVHFKHSAASAWSDWSPNPVVITTKNCSLDTLFAEHFDEVPIAPYVAATPTYGQTAYSYQNYTCQSGLFPTGSESITRDGSGHQGGRFMLNNTTPSCTYASTDQVWRTYSPVNVQQNTNYTLTFSMANQGNFYGGGGLPAALTASINHTALTPAGGVRAGTSAGGTVGDLSWRKYSYTWNSGSSTTAEIAIINNTATSTWNDFAIDDIILTKYKAPVTPGGLGSNVALWSRANKISAPDSSLVALWPNDDVNGPALQQTTVNSRPLLRNNVSDNVNFNPVLSYVQSSNDFMAIPQGVSGSSTHNAAYVYMVSKFNNVSQSATLLREGQTAGPLNGVVLITSGANGVLNFIAGGDNTISNTVFTGTGVNEANKPILWSFSKNINGTASGNKMDIRKNGQVVATNTSASNSAFKGDSENVTIASQNGSSGNFTGNLAEVIYVFDVNMTPLTQNRIESYLALKYGTTLGSTATPSNYTASDSTTVFWTADNKFQNDIFGIGTDSASGLVQTTSNSVNTGSGNGKGISGKGNLVLATQNELLDKRFLMIGNSAAPLTAALISGASPAINGSTRLLRNWRVDNTNGIGAVSLSFDTTGLQTTAWGQFLSNYALLISNSGDTTYAGTVSIFNATGTSGNQIIFNGVTLNDNSVFTILVNLNTALPAVWLGFTAEAVNGNGLLNWKTSDEINVDHYTVEHSYNGVSFSPVGTVAANNSTGENKYSFTDANLAPGLHYYRIRRTDKDGVSGYSETKSIKITTTGANVQVRPNPVVGSTLVLAVSVQQSSKTTVQVMSVDGKILVRQNVNLATGNNLLNVNVSNVPSGIYLVQVQLNDEVVTKKIIRER